ncbi:pleckstrin homology domain-containing family A member 8 isoform X2 [Acipenser ruthenus]|uniref:pleckstrin homology domain-containing family A member 8 isoform X2 n=1 Tax=Acipenser ruthenus TaxID=7906 RepID=UPI00145AA354|nr:pleckstrin homology domain-containing family A member 8 isoform X2 [Acipenser ruthenus]
MEGVLYKWTNYLSGWQPRWFVLVGGTLSYYDSQEDAWKGCKGSIKMSVCEIQVHSSDNTRVDLIIPGEQYFYLKAINAAERQKWLVALGTAKACLTDNRTKREKELHENTEALKTKMSELRLYCDLLLQQVHKIKESSPPAASVSDADVEENIETGTLVKSTCGTFLKTLEECMQIASKTFNSELLPQTPPSSPPVAAIKPDKVKHSNPSSHSITERKKELNNNCRSKAPFEKLSPEEQEKQSELEKPSEAGTPAADSMRGVHDGESSVNVEHTDWEECDDTPAGGSVVKLEGQSEAVSTEEPQAGCSEEKDCDILQQGVQQQDEEENVDTFFSTMGHRFSDIELEDGSGIPTEPFLESCYAIVPVLDKLGPTVFAPVKIDFVGNIKKINQKYISDPENFTTLQKIVLYEVETNMAQVRNSATEALLWLKRGLKFLKEFLAEVNNGEKNIYAALNNAYGKTLRQYHGWVVRGVFALALRAAPSYEGFAAALVSNEGDQRKAGFSKGMHRDLDVYLPAMENQLAILDAMYEEYSLESDEVV